MGWIGISQIARSAHHLRDHTSVEKFVRGTVLAPDTDWVVVRDLQNGFSKDDADCGTHGTEDRMISQTESFLDKILCTFIIAPTDFQPDYLASSMTTVKIRVWYQEEICVIEQEILSHHGNWHTTVLYWHVRIRRNAAEELALCQIALTIFTDTESGEDPQSRPVKDTVDLAKKTEVAIWCSK